MDEHITYIGLDVHKETIAVALAEGSGRGEVYTHGQISNTPAALTRLSSKLSRSGSVLRFCHEAGPCGYGIEAAIGRCGARLRGGGPVAYPAQAGVPDQDGPSGRDQSGGFAPCWCVDDRVDFRPCP